MRTGVAVNPNLWVEVMGLEIKITRNRDDFGRKVSVEKKTLHFGNRMEKRRRDHLALVGKENVSNAVPFIT